MQWKLSVGEDDACLLLAIATSLTNVVPAHVELAVEFLNAFLWRVMRRVSCDGCEISDEWLIGRERLSGFDLVDGLVGHVFGEVIAFLERRIEINTDDTIEDQR